MFNSFHLQGVEAFNKSDYVHAKELFLQAINQNPEVPETYYFLGMTCFLSEARNESIFYLHQFIELTRNVKKHENRSHAFDLLGQCYAANNKNETAITFYYAAIQNDLNCVSARYNLALSYLKLAQQYCKSHTQRCFILLRDAHIALSSVLKICADNPMLYHTIASWHEQYIELLKQFSEDKKIQEDISVNFMCAIHYYHEALAHCPHANHPLKTILTENLVECYAQFGHHLYQIEEYEKAQEIYGLALEGDQKHIPALNQTGMCFFKQRLYPEARKQFAVIFERTEDIQDKADAWISIACCYRLEKNWEEAEKSLEEAKKLTPQNLSIEEEAEKLKQAKSQARLTATNQVFFGLKQDINSSLSSHNTNGAQLN